MDAWRVGIHSIGLARGSTLTLEHADGAVVRLLDGRAWISAGRSNEHLRAGEDVLITGGATTLIYAFEAASLRLEAPDHCSIGLRRRGEVAAVVSANGDDACVNADDASDVARWAELLCTTPQELREAIQAVGPRITDLKRYLLVALIRKHRKDKR